MSATVRSWATIDGNAVDVKPGDTILAAAERAGIEIPTLCHATGLEAEGGCRMCMVEIEGQRPQAACHTPISPGMTVRTASSRLNEIRHDLLSLTLSTTPAGAFRADEHGSKLERLMARFGVKGDEFGNHAKAHRLDTSHPYMRFDRNKALPKGVCGPLPLMAMQVVLMIIWRKIIWEM